MRIALVLLPNWPRKNPSLSIAYLASHIQKEGHDVFRFEFNLKIKNPDWHRYLLDFNRNLDVLDIVLKRPDDLATKRFTGIRKYLRYCVSEILDKEPDLIGFTLVCDNRNLTLAAARILRKHSIVPLIFGGPEIFFRDNLAETYLKNGLVDYIILGEAEMALPLLMQNIDRQKNVPGLWYMENNQLMKNEQALEPNLDSLKYPLFRDDDIKDAEAGWLAIVKDEKILPIVTSRGCIGKCDFCGERKLWNYFRQRSVADVAEEIIHQKEKHGIMTFNFDDCLLNANHAFLVSLCRELVLRDAKIYWNGNCRIDTFLDAEVFRLMYIAGCRTLFFGAESASNRLLKQMKKGINQGLIHKNIKAASENGISVWLSFIIGYPEEREQDFDATMRFIISNRMYIDRFTANGFYLDRKADIYKRVKQTDQAAIRKRLLSISDIVKAHYTPALKENDFTLYERNYGCKLLHQR